MLGVMKIQAMARSDRPRMRPAAPSGVARTALSAIRSIDPTDIGFSPAPARQREDGRPPEDVEPDAGGYIRVA